MRDISVTLHVRIVLILEGHRFSTKSVSSPPPPPPPLPRRKREGGSSNLKQQDTTLVNLKDPFSKEIIQYWAKFKYRNESLEFASTCILCNSH